MHHEMAPRQHGAEDPVVIVGFAFRFPQEAVSEDAFWNIIRDGLSTRTEVPRSRYNINGHNSQTPGRQDTSHFIKGDISTFDAPFFKMSSVEAKAMDPQLRLLLETTYHAFENAGVSLDKVQGSNTSVYVGNLAQEYVSLFSHDGEISAKYQATGNSAAMLSNRLSWFYDLRGPSVSIDTACSSSLVALHIACQSLLRGESDMSIVGGVQLQLDPMTMTAPISRLGFLSPDGQCYSFDDRANGYSRAEGVGMVVLKRLSHAVRDGDTIRAVIRGTSANQDGRTPSISQPSATAQAALIRKAYEPLGDDFGLPGYFEAHGTGTAIGDPIEAEAISLAFSGLLSPETPLHVGSVKANIGHLEPSAGIAGLIKTVLMLERGVIPPNALLENLNPRIKADKWHLKFPTSALPWPTEGLRRASVNSFGFGGTNSHVVIDDALHYLQSQDRSQPLANGAVTNGISKAVPDKLLFLLCAADENGVRRQAAALENHLAQPDRAFSSEYLQDLAFTLGSRRSMLPWKSFALGASAQELQQSLHGLSQKPIRATGTSPLVHFVFTGQGSQWAGMGKELLPRHSVFRESIEHADAFFRSLGSEWSLVVQEQLCTPASQLDIDNPSLAQPLCTALQIALVDLLASWHISPQAVVGHSSGEIAAAYCAGALAKDSALRAAYFRGEAVSRLLQDNQAAKGGMLAVGLSEAELDPYLAVVQGDAGSLACSCVNSPKSVTVSGDETLVQELERRLQADKVFARKLNVPVAYHSRQMGAVADFYRATLQGQLDSEPQRLPSAFYSSVTGKEAWGHDLRQADYWVANLVSQVKFSEALRLMCSSLAGNGQTDVKPLPYLLEIGPHCTLERPVRETVAGDAEYAYDCTMRRNVSSVDTVKGMLGRLAVHGHAVDLQVVNRHDITSRQPRMLVNLPKYPFNHSQSYWIESRLSKNARNRERPRHELLGTPESDIPWVSDHKINNTVLYPAAGMLVMVLEGIRSLAAKMPRVTGFRLRDVGIGSALVVPSTDEGVEAQLHMSSHDTASTKEALVFDFCIFSVAGDDWKMHCSGLVAIEHAAVSDTVSEDGALAATEGSFNEAHERCSASIDRAQFYRDLYQKGATFGERFQTLHGIRFSEHGREATADLPFGEWQRRVRQRELTEHMVHPATLDGLIHILFASVYKDLLKLPTMVPTQLSEVFFSPSLLGGDVGDTLRLYGNVTERGLSSMDGNVTAVSASTGTPLITFRGLRLLGVQATDSLGDGPPEPTGLFHQVSWKPDISLLSQAEIEEYCRHETQDMAGGCFDTKMEIICRHFLSRMLDDLALAPANLSRDHFNNYIKWAKAFLEHESESTLTLEKTLPGFEEDDVQRRHLVDEYASEGPQRQLIASFGRKLVPMLAGELDPLEILFNDGLADSLYQSPLFSFTAHRLAAYMDLLSHKSSDMKIIEVGAGTGSTTTVVLDALSRHGRFAGASARLGHYDFTDISPGFLAGAQEKYAAHAGRMRFKTLDIERDPGEQGFECGSYDVVIAAAVLHATTSIDKALRNVKKLLKSGGRLVFSEPTNRRLATIPYAFGVLPGWWLSTEKHRSSGPLLTRSEWNEALLRAGFDGLEVSLPDNVEESHGLSLLVSRPARSPEDPSAEAEPLTTLIVTETQYQEDMATLLQAQLTSQSNGVCVVTPSSQLATGESKYDQCICLMELGKPIMAHLTEAQFATLRHVMDAARQVIWVTDNCGEAAENPEAAMIAGFAKTLMRERPSLNFAHLNVQAGARVAETILRVVDQSRRVPAEHQETDLVEENGVISIPRVVEAPHINSLFDSEAHAEPRPVQVGKGVEAGAADALELRFSPGRLDSLHFGPSASASLPLGNDQVRVRVMATGINFKDVMVALNQVADDHIGQEFAGVVTEVGAGLKGAFGPGDHVCGIAAGGGFQSCVRAKGCHTIKMPPGISFAEASAIPLAYATAQYGLHHLARLQPGESILIHAAAGAVGQAAIQLAQRAGAAIYVTVSTPEKKKLLMDRYGIEPSHFFSSRHILFAQQLLQRTGGKGVDVVLNSLAGQALRESWRCVAPFGRFIEIGKRDASTFKALPMEPFLRNVSFCSLDLQVVARLNDALMGRIMREVEALVQDPTASAKHLIPYPLTVFKRSGFEQAFRLLQTGRHVGKAVVDWEQADTIQVIPKSPLDYRFDAEATYVIAGGLGGIGRHTAAWMCRHGARNVMLLSRSGPKSEAAKELVASLEKGGVSVYAPKCDISDPEAVEAVVTHAKANMPPIKGCIQASMVVENHIFENYTLPAFQAALGSKVQGTLNLHSHLPPDMDFFVLLSSLAGIHGAGSQSNYAAANAFLDGFARFRHAQGQRCVSLDLGFVESIGFIAERADVAQSMAMTYLDHRALRESDLFFLLKYACNPLLDVPSPWETQILGALTTPAFVRRGGLLQEHRWMHLPVFRHLYCMEEQGHEGSTAAGAEQVDGAAAQLRAAASVAEAAAAITGLFAKRLARSLAVPVEDIDIDRPPYAFGVDSLVAVELVGWFSNEIRADVPVVQILSRSTIAQLGLLAAEKSLHMQQK
ncbi:KR domain-containing protein [Hirsutella rhossiliensis]|uniref:KR domain-containing protein n=1 Tax=Hirsutella rhossiliensis TaxID=111463 RepID=A0A9P8MX04_9HYPO|nr:KR domain-containing protein [Hirsutella rhossiliensis]KAH0963848.1 KR domain-containing protein [Hirsutella rhossiliensis]